MNPTIDLTDEGRLSLHDPIESTQFELLTDRPVDPTPVPADRIPFPVDAAVAVTVGELVVPKLVHVTVRRPDGEFLTEYSADESELVEHGARLLDVWSAPMPLYVHAPGPMKFRSDGSAVRVEFREPVDVVIGCRSLHDRPAATVTVPPEPEPIMRAVSAFGSALATTSCERSYPTLRGHPPRVELGPELSVPDRLDVPDTGVTLELPPSLEYVFPAAPLAYYLGADLEPGVAPTLRADGFVHPLDGPGGFEATVGRTLRQLFLFDAVVRTEGIYQVDLAERDQLLARLDGEFDPAALYDAPLPEQLAAYLSVGFDRVRDLLPEWPLCVDVAPEPRYARALPYLVDDLAVVRTVDREPGSAAATPEPAPEPGSEYAAAVDDFVRSDGAGVVGESADEIEETFRLPEAPAIEHAYLGPGCPLGANKSSVSALRRRLDRSPAEEPGISVRIVCNDEEMTEEGVVEEYYGLREMVQFDVTVDYGLSCPDIRGVLESDVDFLHYIGHIDEEGIACTDGKFDARELEDVGVDAFLLNACSSYEQGRALVDAGAHGGVVTTSTVSNAVATAMGQTLSRALNTGFTLRSALSIADRYHPTAYRYLVLGDGGMQLVQGEGGTPEFLVIEPMHEDVPEDYTVDLEVYPASGYGPGLFTSPYLEKASAYLPFGHIETFEISRGELLEFLEQQVVPVAINDRLHWSDELLTSDLI